MSAACSDIQIVDFLALELSGVCIWCKTSLPSTSRKRRPRKYCDDACRMSRKRHIDQPSTMNVFVPRHDAADYCSVCHILLPTSLEFATQHQQQCEFRKPVKVTVEPDLAQFVVVPFQTTRLVEAFPKWNVIRDWVRLGCVYGFNIYNHSKITGIKPKGGPRTTVGKIRGKLHDIGGRWCKCAECLATRRG
jgi:hypothetical protein